MTSHSNSTDQMPQYRIRAMRAEDVPAVLEIWAANDLHEGTGTIQSFLAQDPEGFVVAVEVVDFEEVDIEQDKDGKKCHAGVQVYLNEKNGQEKLSTLREKRILGMCAGLFVHPTTAFIGLYGVRPELQGRGIGIAMWNLMMEHVGSCNAGLYAVPEHLVTYRDRAGFRNPDERLLLIYESELSTDLRLDLLVESIRGVRIETITKDWFERVVEFDSDVHGYSRGKLLPRVFNEPDSSALVAVDTEDGTILGYGCLRTNNIGKAMLGPLYASDDAIAELVMRHLFAALPGPVSRGLLYMTLDSNPGGERIADKLGLPQHEQLQRFFREEPYLQARWDLVYCIHSPNFSLL